MSFDADPRRKRGTRVHRRRLEIVRDMLSVALIKTKKTRIMYQANLSYRLMEKYLNSILDSGLIECGDDSCYSVTKKGKEFLQMYEDYLQRRRKIGEEIKGVHNDKVLLENICFDNENNSRRMSSGKEVVVQA